MKTRVNTKNKILGLLILSIAGLLTEVARSACTDVNERYCQADGTFDTWDTGANRLAYMGVNTKLDWVMFEGSIPLLQSGIMWVEITDDTRYQYQIKNGGQKTSEVMRIREAYALANPGNQYLDLVGTENVQRQFIFEDDVTAANNYGWFAGDVVVFQNCAYVVKMQSANNDNSNKVFTFERYNQYITWNSTSEGRQMTIERDHQEAFSSANSNWSNFPKYMAEINYNPYWGAFYYYVRGNLYLLQDSHADTEDSCDNYACDQNKVTNYCSRENWLFDQASGSTLIEHEIPISSSTSWQDEIISQALVFDSIFIVLDSAPTTVIRVAGSVAVGPPNTLTIVANQAFYTLTNTEYPNINLGVKFTQMCSLDYYGIFLGTDSGQYIAALAPTIDSFVDTDNTYQPVLDADGMVQLTQDPATTYVQRDVSTYDASAGHYRILQTRGYMSRHRPCFVVTDNERQRMIRMTTVFNPYMDLGTGPQAGMSDLYDPAFPEPQTLRFHMMTIEPRDLSTGAIDYDKASAQVIDLRANDQVASYPVDECGDSAYNTTFEICEFTMDPPIPNTANAFGYYDNNGAGSHYPEHDSGFNLNSRPSNSTIVYTTGYKHDLYSSTCAAADVWEDPSCEGYFTCNEKCRLVQYNGCGDGVPTNGPVPSDLITAALDANQRSGTLGWEACDDNNTDDGDGCSGDCSTIEPGYECLEWGWPCTPLCGNGHIEVYEEDGPVIDVDTGELEYYRGDPKPVIPVYDNSGTLTGYRVEECDFGAANVDPAAADYYKHACTTECLMVDSARWDCDKSHFLEEVETNWRNWPVVTDPSDGSTVQDGRHLWYGVCYYMCGNRVVDVGSPYEETCDQGAQPFSYVYKGDWYDNTGSTVAEADIDAWDRDPVTNTALVLGCNQDCKAVSNAVDGGIHEFKCPLVWEIWDEYGKTEAEMPYRCTDRCGDGIMDGPITNGGTTLRAGDMPTGIAYVQTTDYGTAAGITSITGITAYIQDDNYDHDDQSYEPINYADRLFREECDNGGIIDADGRMHGCDNFCQIIDGWSCTHYYHHLIKNEYPIFTSECELDVDPCQGSSCRRRLSMRSDENGRRLHHIVLEAYKYTLPANTHEMRNDKLRLHFDTKFGTNGQLRMFENPGADETVWGFVYAQQYEDALIADTVEIRWYNLEGSATRVPYSFTAPLQDGIFSGKVRNTFGKYVVLNQDTYTLSINGYTFTDETDVRIASGSSLFTSTAEPSVQLMGSHEFYWFPYKSFLMARLADGRSYKFWRFSSTFEADLASGTSDSAKVVEQSEYNLFQVPGRVMIPPVFHGKMGYFYTSGTQVDKIAKLLAYEWSDIQNAFELKCSKDLTPETTQNLYHKYSLINVGDDGVLFKANADANVYRYLCDPDSATWTADAVPVTFDMNGMECGSVTLGTTLDDAAITMLQVRNDPDSYTEPSVNSIYGLMNDLCVLGLTYTSDVVQVTSVIDLEARDYRLYTVTPEHFDVTNRHFILFSPVQCDPNAENKDTNYVLNPSVDVYQFSDETWDCWDLPATDRGTYAWDLPRDDTDIPVVVVP